MQFLRISLLFALFTFSIARAVCVDFEIFANKTSLGCAAVVSTNIVYGDPLILSISPANGNIEWRATDVVVIGTASTYTPIITESENKIITYFVERNGVSKTINVYVQARPSYTVSFNTDGGTPLSIAPQIVFKDSLAKKPLETLTKLGYDFEGWDFNFNTPIIKDTTIIAKWKTKTFTVSFNSDGGSAVASQIVNYNSTVSVPNPAPTKAGYVFEGWDFDFSTLITQNTTIKAKWKDREYTIDLFVKGKIEFANTGFYIDDSLSSKQRHYFVAGSSLCEIKNTKIQIMLQEPDIVLRIKNIPQRSTDGNGLHYDINFDFGKPGLDTLIYELLSKDGLKNGFDTILIETPIPFDSIVGQKWNNVLFVNNNKDYKFKDFKWFKNDKEVGNLQFYSAGPSNLNVLNINDIYKVTMHTKDGIRISTCEGKAKFITAPAQQPKPTLTKQVLGIGEKPLNSDSKIYNLKGKLTKETPAGVYIVEE